MRSRHVMVRGGVAHLGDLHRLHELAAQGLDGILLDDGLCSGAFSYAEAVAAGAESFDMWHWAPPSWTELDGRDTSDSRRRCWVVGRKALSPRR